VKRLQQKAIQYAFNHFCCVYSYHSCVYNMFSCIHSDKNIPPMKIFTLGNNAQIYDQSIKLLSVVVLCGDMQKVMDSHSETIFRI
jgi:hypothetical protein